MQMKLAKVRRLVMEFERDKFVEEAIEEFAKEGLVKGEFVKGEMAEYAVPCGS